MIVKYFFGFVAAAIYIYVTYRFFYHIGRRKRSTSYLVMRVSYLLCLFVTFVFLYFIIFNDKLLLDEDPVWSDLLVLIIVVLPNFEPFYTKAYRNRLQMKYKYIKMNKVKKKKKITKKIRILYNLLSIFNLFVIFLIYYFIQLKL